MLIYFAKAFWQYGHRDTRRINVVRVLLILLVSQSLSCRTFSSIIHFEFQLRTLDSPSHSILARAPRNIECLQCFSVKTSFSRLLICNFINWFSFSHSQTWIFLRSAYQTIKIFDRLNLKNLPIFHRKNFDIWN